MKDRITKQRKDKMRKARAEFMQTSTEESNVNASGNAYENTRINTSDNLNEMDMESIIQKQQSKFNRAKFEDEYKKRTFWVRNDILNTLDKMTEGQRGEKTRILNEALIDYMKKIEKND